ncbi:hypothetical protein [Gloeocapsa sp. PCC 73106]|uniref:glutaredoxin family protein n=1 Tax=Gloeocapsa sp. PCC 73106 TaxID=102232 RepID=UPI0002ACC4C9|nr:hypothetical protein [Gloeocapsa sp. PCC 73106]ELR99253.1 glutaredoxin-like protein [Gloeocapsa sp. PCC 73106]
MKYHRSNWRQLALISIITATISLTGLFGGVYASQSPPKPDTILAQAQPPAITTESGPAEIALAEHLQGIDAKIYTAYTCPHCHSQKELLGKKAASLLNNIECHPDGENAQPELCEAAGITGVPTWEIKGELYPGVQPLETIADLSGYTGSRAFIHPFPY